MTQTAKLTASDGNKWDYFGDSVAISGNTVAVGAYSATVGGIYAGVRPMYSRSRLPVGKI